MKVTNSEGDALTIVSLNSTGESPTTYNLEIDDFHTYFVGEQNVLVHNCTCKISGDDAVPNKAATGGTYPTKYHKISVEEVEVLRTQFESVKPDFVRDYVNTAEAAKRFTPKQLQKMAKSGKLPRGFIIHHKTPLFRGGNNAFENLRVMNSKFHQRYNKRLHWYEEGYNIYQN